MAKLSKNEVLKLAQLARIRLNEDEVVQYQKELAAILQYVELLNTVDLSEYEPTSQVTGLVNVTREDVIEKQVSSDVLLKSVPEQEENYIKVKRMLG